jgi:hypothetical protein
MRSLALVLALLPAAVGFAEDPKPAPAGAEPAALPKIASDEEAKAAIERFKASFKGNDVAKKGTALFALAKVQHPDVSTELGKHLTNRNVELKAATAMAFADQTALPAIAGPKLVAAFPPNDGDAAWLMTAVDGIESMKYRAGLPVLLKLLKHKNNAVVKHSLLALARMKDMRALDDLLAMMKELKIDAGYSWEGGEVSVDTGAPGTADQEAAEAQYQQQYGNNGAKGRSAGRKMRDIGEVLLTAMKELTGQQFTKTATAKEWAEKNKAAIDERKRVLTEEQERQEKEAAAVLAALKERRK